VRELEQFFRDLRALRAGAGLSTAELAGRAHYPEEALAAAETGPGVPANPVLVAYVRGCGGPVGEWEDRWREASAAASRAEAPTEVLERVRGTAPVRSSRGRRVAVAAAAGALIAGGSVAVLARPSAHSRPAAQPLASPGILHESASAPPTVPAAAPSPSAVASTVPVRDVAGVGCPGGRGDGVTLDAATPGPPWSAAGGGWTGDGCNGASVWTAVPPGKHPKASTLTWFIGGTADGAQCTLSVFVPAQNALGEASYLVSGGSSALGAVTIDQTANAGRWVELGSYRGASSGYEIQLMPQTTTLTAAGPAGPGGKPAPPAPHGRDSVAASAAAMTCSP
jgi:Helix-turn-helix domain